MIGQTEFTTPPHATIVSRERLKQFKEWGVSDYLKIEPQLLGVQNWAEMLAQTQRDKKERGFVVSTNGRKLLISQVSEGEERSFSTPVFPHGVRTLMPNTKDLVYVHTHYMSPEIDHVQTSAFSDLDINAFARSRARAIVAVDRGGTHMLARKQYSLPQREPMPKIEVAMDAIKRAKAGGNTAIDVVKEIAKDLEKFGVLYYYSPQLTPSPEGFIEFKAASKY